MRILPKMLFILVGENDTGKTTFQKLLIEKLCSHSYDRLPVNVKFPITHPEIKRKFRDISFANRSYQEKKGEYGSVDEYFQHHFAEADLAIVSSHLSLQDIRDMMANAHQRFYNVTGIFWSNDIQERKQANGLISALPWNERLLVENPHTADVHQMNRQLVATAESFVYFLINRTSIS